jgi:hypothetical protein
LLAPYAIAKGAKPIWVGLNKEKNSDVFNYHEIVIARYPNLNTLIDIFTGKYYESINWLRERGVKKLGFSVCESRFGDRSPGKRDHLVVCFNHECKENKEVEELFISETENICKIQYIAREVCNLDIFMEYKNTDPIEMKYKNIGILSNEIFKNGAKDEFNERMIKRGFKSISRKFRYLKISESMPWSKRQEVI